ATLCLPVSRPPLISSPYPMLFRSAGQGGVPALVGAGRGGDAPGAGHHHVRADGGAGAPGAASRALAGAGPRTPDRGAGERLTSSVSYSDAPRGSRAIHSILPHCPTAPLMLKWVDMIT